MTKKWVRYLVALLCMHVFFLNTSSAQEPLRQWTDTQGKKATARLVKIEDDQLTLRDKQGKTFTIRLSRLSAKDNLYIRGKLLRDKAMPQQVPSTKTLLEMATEQAGRIEDSVVRTGSLLRIATLLSELGFDDTAVVSQAYTVYHAQEAKVQLKMLPYFLAYHASVGDLEVSRDLLDNLPNMTCQRVSTYTTQHTETVWVDETRTERIEESVVVSNCTMSCSSDCNQHTRTETVYRDESYVVNVPVNVVNEQLHYDYFTSPPTEEETLGIYLKYADVLAVYGFTEETRHVLAVVKPLLASLPQSGRDQSLAFISQIQMQIGEMSSAFQVSERITLSSLRVRSMCEMAKIYLLAGHTREYDTYIEDAYSQVVWEMQTSKTPRDTAVAAAGLNEVLATMLLNGDKDIPEAYLKEAKRMIPKLGVLNDRLLFCKTLADIYLKKGNHTQARALQVLLPEFKIPLLAHIIDVQTASRLGNEAEKTLKIMRAHTAKLKNTEDRLVCYLHCAVRYKKLGFEKQVVGIFSSVEKSAEKLRGASARQRIYLHIARAYVSMKDFGNAEKVMLKLEDTNIRNEIILKIAKQKVTENMLEDAYHLALVAAEGETAAVIFIAIAEHARKKVVGK